MEGGGGGRASRDRRLTLGVWLSGTGASENKNKGEASALPSRAREDAGSVPGPWALLTGEHRTSLCPEPRL